jgi:hypothetical protein
MRVPRITGLPSMIFGLTSIRSSCAMCLLLAMPLPAHILGQEKTAL